MEKCGYPVNEKQGMAILKLMFKLRGLEKEWEIYHKIKNGGSIWKHGIMKWSALMEIMQI